MSYCHNGLWLRKTGGTKRKHKQTDKTQKHFLSESNHMDSDRNYCNVQPLIPFWDRTSHLLKVQNLCNQMTVTKHRKHFGLSSSCSISSDGA